MVREQNQLKSWPFKEARSVETMLKEKPEGPVLLETGFGPSGLPHIGTFSEVARTTWVARALTTLTDWPTRLIAFSDDLDGLRKVPTNMPQREMLAEHLEKPLCKIPDPFGCCSSYSQHMNNKLKEFLDAYGFDYQFQSSYEAYTQGDFDEGLLLLLHKVEEVKAIILPTLGEEKREHWSPFLPLCSQCGRVNSTRVTEYHPLEGEISYTCLAEQCGHRERTSVRGGRVKAQWKVDWALRWYSYDIAYEMYGKDLIDSANLSKRIIALMGKRPPQGMFYELFLDEEGRKISKSVGEGLTVDAWTRYAPLESLLFYIFQNPRRARRLHWDVIPKAVDGYLEELRRYPNIPQEKKADSPIWHIFKGGTEVPTYAADIVFSLIHNLLAGVGIEDMDVLQGFLERYDPQAREDKKLVRELLEKSVNYYRDFVLPYKDFPVPTEDEREIFRALREALTRVQGEDEEEIQSIPFDVARSREQSPKEIFTALYRVIFGQERGPRFGTFVKLLGQKKVLELLEEAECRS